MSSITFNNLNFCKKLTDTGMPPQQANVLAESIHEITTSINNTLTVIENTFATKKDLEKFVTKDELRIELATLKYDITTELRAEIKSEIKEVKIEVKEVKADMKRLEVDILDLKSNVKVLNWMMGFLIAGVASLVMKAFF